MVSFDLLTESSAQFSPCRRWRYTLQRRWDAKLPCVNFLLLNPSTADETRNDPTVERCQRRAEKMGYGTLFVTNIFAWRSTDPVVLNQVPDPVGPDNDDAIMQCAAQSALVVCGWGNHGQIAGRGAAVLAMLRAAGIKPHCLAVTGQGQPRHPLYVGYSRQPFPMPS